MKYSSLLLAIITALTSFAAEGVSGDNIYGITDEAAWWRGFDDPLLDSLITIGTEANYDLAAAATRVQIAKAQLGQARAAYYPTLSLSAGYTRTRVSGNTAAASSPASTESYYSATVDMSWEIDVFGKITRQVRQRKASVQVSAAEYAAAVNSVQAQIASTYFGLLCSKLQLELANTHAESQHNIMQTTESRFEAGLASKLDVTQARTLYYSTIAQIPMLEASIEASVNALGVLLAVDPSELPQGVLRTRPLPNYTRLVSGTVPADLMRRRPDIVEAEKNIDAAAAALGIARSEYLPSLTLNGSVGVQAHRPGDLFKSSSMTYTVAPTLTWTIFDGLGRRYASAEASESLRAAVDSYNLTLLTAVQEVRNAATRYSNSLRYLASLTEVVENAAESTRLSFDLYREGLTPFVNVDNAEMDFLTYENSILTAKTDALNALVDLFKAIGGSYTPQ